MAVESMYSSSNLLQYHHQQFYPEANNEQQIINANKQMLNPPLVLSTGSAAAAAAMFYPAADPTVQMNISDDYGRQPKTTSPINTSTTLSHDYLTFNNTNTNTNNTFIIPLMKPSRQSIDQINYPALPDSFQSPHDFDKSSQFVGHNPQFQRQDIDTIIARHEKKMKIGIEEIQKQQNRVLGASIVHGVKKKLIEKDEEINKMKKINMVLQDKIRSLFIENQVLRDVAQASEATVISLRHNLEQILLAHSATAEEEDDAASSCGSNGAEQDKERSCYTVEMIRRRCKRCGVKESCVLVLPCKHLCLCYGCGSGSHQIQSCPVCNSIMDATLHVNISPK